LKAEVAVLNAFSAHAGQDEILEYLSTIDKTKLRTLFLVHGEPPQSDALAAKLKEGGYRDVSIPDRGEIVEHR
jgi:metallo-beta-lactamase family protein